MVYTCSCSKQQSNSFSLLTQEESPLCAFLHQLPWLITVHEAINGWWWQWERALMSPSSLPSWGESVTPSFPGCSVRFWPGCCLTNTNSRSGHCIQTRAVLLFQATEMTIAIGYRTLHSCQHLFNTQCVTRIFSAQTMIRTFSWHAWAHLHLKPNYIDTQTPIGIWTELYCSTGNYNWLDTMIQVSCRVVSLQFCMASRKCCM